MEMLGWVLAVIAAFSIGLAKGGLSMVGTISVPLLALVMSPVQAAGILLPVYIISDIGGLIAFRRDFDARVLRTLVPGAITGIALGWATAHHVDDAQVGLIVGVIGLAFALNALLRSRVSASARPPRWGAGSFWGTISGYTSFVSHSGAAPYQVYAQPLRMTPMTYAGTTTIFFAICNAVKLIPYAMLGQLSAHNLSVAAVLMVPGVLGVLAGLWLVRRMSAQVFYGFITWALMLVSAKLIWDGI
ncbi:MULTISPECIES: sulfite exporter TauE/SafE family protein [Paracoccus]|nr:MULTISPECIES: sulfite exporter TauE/SafE family protein [Paracoccus]WGR61096.1 sulfite exporter TauE/SafE family protein [Paracoccus ferrooxidans]MBT0779820.1 sulfite exporter TauE/SafE family protein [Paracoccus sp. pheM1]MCJ1898923.1 sulfite exporter TauE/SafE family protein [Paracoccus versutus]MDF3903328.1 sulfite exporter TauE/SafE family protein [Paracoccus sp. AS002]RDD73011.1 sulfite exporter TauE/SafE family protein [Paracoccus versutus]